MSCSRQSMHMSEQFCEKVLRKIIGFKIKCSLGKSKFSNYRNLKI
jgi:hypothetical protein